MFAFCSSSDDSVTARQLIALSNVTVEHIERARKIAPIESVQNRYSFADREWDHVVDYGERNRIGFIPRFPLCQSSYCGIQRAWLEKRPFTKQIW